MRTLIVPTEPTEAMLDAMADCLGESRVDCVLSSIVMRHVYRAALGARVRETHPDPPIDPMCDILDYHLLADTDKEPEE